MLILSSDMGECEDLLGHLRACLFLCDHPESSMENLHHAPKTHSPADMPSWGPCEVHPYSPDNLQKMYAFSQARTRNLSLSNQTCKQNYKLSHTEKMEYVLAHLDFSCRVSIKSNLVLNQSSYSRLIFQTM